MERACRFIVVLASFFLLAGPGWALADRKGENEIEVDVMGGSRDAASVNRQGADGRLGEKGEEGVEQRKRGGAEFGSTPGKPAAPTNLRIVPPEATSTAPPVPPYK